MSESPAKCPVDHSSLTSSEEKCPVEHKAGSSWRNFLSSSKTNPPIPSQPIGEPSLSKDRETSSIPRLDGDKWVYPSEAQFFAAMARKNHEPQAPDMRVIVPIHNAVNERAWSQLMKWEAGKGGDKCGGVKLVSFKGRPDDLSPRARWRSLIGYARPFDRHDWIVDRCGTRIRYVIDFYTGKNQAPDSNNLSFYLDVRPAVDSWEGVKMRMGNFWQRWLGKAQDSSDLASTHTSK